MEPTTLTISSKNLTSATQECLLDPTNVEHYPGIIVTAYNNRDDVYLIGIDHTKVSLFDIPSDLRHLIEYCAIHNIKQVLVDEYAKPFKRLNTYN